MIDHALRCAQLLVVLAMVVPSGCSGSGSGGRQDDDAGTKPLGADAGDASEPPGECVSGPERNGPYDRVTVLGETAPLGIIDPSVEYGADERSGWMTYTAVPGFDQVHIGIARSDDSGASWQHVSDVAEARPITVATTDESVCGSPSCAGTLVHESSSLVVDPFDPDPARRFKVFAHTYFFGTERQLELGYLALYTAGSAEGPWAETKLFGWPSSSPISTTDVAYDLATDATLTSLRDCLIVGEPGALVRAPGTIDLALACVTPESDDTATIDIRLLRSADHAATFTYVGTLLSAEDARALGAVSNQINGADLFFANEAYHLIATPIGLVDFPEGQAEGYRGCVVVSIADLDAGKVARCDGAPVLEASYLGKPGQFVGACSAAAGASAAGMLIPVPNLSAEEPFQLFASRLSIP